VISDDPKDPNNVVLMAPPVAPTRTVSHTSHTAMMITLLADANGESRAGDIIAGLPNLMLDPKGNIDRRQQATLANIEHVMGEIGVQVRHNLMTKQLELVLPPTITQDQLQAHSKTVDPSGLAMALVCDVCCSLGMLARGEIKNCLADLGARHPYHPGGEWLDTLPAYNPKAHAGAIKRLGDTVDLENEAERDRWNEGLRLWLIQAVQAAFGWDDPQPMDLVLLLVSHHQGVGKSRWLSRLVPPHLFLGEQHLALGSAHAERDTITRVTGAWIVELSEVAQSIHSQRQAIKTFLSRPVDRLRPAYARGDHNFARGTVFSSSSDHTSILVDDAGNRRWLPNTVTKLRWKEVTPELREAAWIEAIEMWEAGETWHPSEDWAKRFAVATRDYRAGNDIEELLDELLGAWAGVDMKAFQDAFPDHVERLNLGEVMRQMDGGLAVGGKQGFQTRNLVKNWLDKNLGRPSTARIPGRPNPKKGCYRIPERGLRGEGYRQAPAVIEWRLKHGHGA
jgi:hypothetical protein